MWYICERCGAVSKEGATLFLRVAIPEPDVIDEEYCHEEKEVCRDCFDAWQKKRWQAELAADAEFRRGNDGSC